MWFHAKIDLDSVEWALIYLVFDFLGISLLVDAQGTPHVNTKSPHAYEQY